METGPGVAAEAPLASTSPTEAAIPEPQVSPDSGGANQPVRLPSQIDSLEKGAYYVQVGVFASDQGLVDAASGLNVAWPLASEKISGPKGDQYRLIIGPVARDESGLYIVQLQ